MKATTTVTTNYSYRLLATTRVLAIGTMLLVVATSSMANASVAAASKPPTTTALDTITRDEFAAVLASVFGTGARGTKLTTALDEHLDEHASTSTDGSSSKPLASLASLTRDDLTQDLGMTKLQARRFRSALNKLGMTKLQARRFRSALNKLLLELPDESSSGAEESSESSSEEQQQSASASATDQTAIAVSVAITNDTKRDTNSNTTTTAEPEDEGVSAPATPQTELDTITRDEFAAVLASVFGTGARGTKLATALDEHLDEHASTSTDGSSSKPLASLASLTRDDLTQDLGMTKLQARRFRSALNKLLLELPDESSSGAEESSESSSEEQQQSASASATDPTAIAVAITNDTKRDTNSNTTTTAKPEDEGVSAPATPRTKNASAAAADTIDRGSSFYNNPREGSHCRKLCAKHHHNTGTKKHERFPPGTNATAFRTAIGDWSRDPSASPYGPVPGCWDVSHITDFSGAFAHLRSFDGDLRCWDVSSATTMDRMFAGAVRFDQPLWSWNVSGVTSMRELFAGAHSFDRPLADWDVGSVTDASGMFFDARAFDRPLGAWNVSNVRTMAYMFAAATAFDQPLGEWDTANVEDFRSAFDYALRFNQPLSNWTISGATPKHLHRMFHEAEAFDQNLCDWAKQKQKQKGGHTNKKTKGNRNRAAQPPPDHNKDANELELFEGTSCPKPRNPRKNRPAAVATKHWCHSCA